MIKAVDKQRILDSLDQAIKDQGSALTRRFARELYNDIKTGKYDIKGDRDGQR